uniref:Solute carrier family 12 member 2 n=1 Tax=Trichuris muris TaxID=70415 RepID=A0A5S6QLM9_TRIMR
MNAKMDDGKQTRRFIVSRKKTIDLLTPAELCGQDARKMSINAKRSIEIRDRLKNDDCTTKQVHFSTVVDKEGTLGKEHAPEQLSSDAMSTCAINMKTVETLPHIDHYRNMTSVVNVFSSRPTLDELREGTHSLPCGAEKSLSRKRSTLEIITGTMHSKPAQKLGWIQGVLIRCILCIFGVILYLRLAWITAHAGVALGLVIVFLASSVTILTSLSLCAISTNGEVKGGGVYFLLSRSLGPEFGGSIGLLFSFANAVAVAMYIVGFGESVVEVMKQSNALIVDGYTNDIRIISLLTAVILLAIVIMGVAFETKAQLILLAILMISIMNFFIGTFVPKSEELQAKGLQGYSWQTFTNNLLPTFREETFFSLFAVYFPAATGIMAGANISGDLKEPHTAIPKGTILAILITSGIYCLCILATGFTCLKEASGSVQDLRNGTISACEGHSNCTYGSMNYFQIMEMQSLFPPIVTAGIFAASLSSALSSMVSAPKIFQALCKDNLFPYIGYFGKGYGRNNEPRPAYVLTFLIACGVIVIGDLNVIAPIISNFFLASYALINYACFDASHSQSPGFRPAFKYYNKWLSLCGAALCVSVMVVSNWWATLVTLAVMLVLYVILLRRKPDVNWGSSVQAHAYRNALNAMLRLSQTEEHVKNYRPQMLVMTGEPMMRPHLIDFASSITKDTSLLICAEVVVQQFPERLVKALPDIQSRYSLWLRSQKYRSFFHLVSAKSMDDGARQLLQTCGLGKLKPNIMLIGFKHAWQFRPAEEVCQYINIIDHAFAANFGVCVLRTNRVAIPAPRKTPLNIVTEEKHEEEQHLIKDGERKSGTGDYLQDGSDDYANEHSPVNCDNKQEQQPFQAIRRISVIDHNSFFSRIKKATIDVYWLFDDGGLTLLLPHLLTLPKSYLQGARMRVFTIASSKEYLEQQETSMAALLSKFRVNFSEVNVIPKIINPNKESIDQFEQFVQPLIGNLVTETELAKEKIRTWRYIRTREFMLANSTNSALIVTTMPVPRKGACDYGLYMVWLDLLSRDLPTVLLVRGNQQSVLTFYS